MRKYQLLFFAFVLVILISFSCKKSEVKIPLPSNSIEKKIEIVPEPTARTIAETFNPTAYYKLSNPSNHSPFHIQLNGNNQVESEYTIYDHANLPTIYVYSFSANNGYLFVSADYQMQPILAFVENGKFKPGKAPGGFILWLNKTIDNIEIIRKGLYDNTLLAYTDWNNYIKSVGSNNLLKNTASPFIQPPPPPPNPCTTNPNYILYTTVTYGPLLPIAWGQGDTYNNLCPNLGCIQYQDRCAPTGCAATAMAMVIRYWEWPASLYNYSAMPINSGDINVQYLMHDAGKSVGMTYNCSGSYISEAWFAGILLTESVTQQIASGFKVPFGYSSATAKIYGSDGTTVNANISYGWPVIFSGYPSWNATFNYPEGVGHIWVCDGSSETTENFCFNGIEQTQTTLSLHMNWGWMEAGATTNFNGWFAFNSFYIPQSSINYQYFNEIAYNIHP